MANVQEVTDDPTIPDDVLLWRRIRKVDIKNLGDGNFRPKSSCFSDSSGDTSEESSMSMTLAGELGMSPEEYLTNWNEEGLISLSAGQLRNYNLAIKRSKSIDGKDPAHVSVIGKKTKPIKRKLAIESKWVILPI